MTKLWKTSSVLALSLLLAVCLLLCSCATACDTDPPPPDPYGKFQEADYLKVDGELVRKERGTGDVVMLRGTNAGGYLLIEQWMTAVKNGRDHKTTSDILRERFGEEKMQELWAYYREQYWSEEDFANCAAMGMTVLRLPFSYMNVDFGGKYDFSQLDDFVRGAAEQGIYTILDLHGAYGSQNGKDHSGEVIDDLADVDFYANEEKIARTVALWEALTDHYKDDPRVAGFDLLNEPGELAGNTSKRHWDVFDRIYDAVRAKDEDRILIFESCWEAENLPDPKDYGWTNCMYSYHHYPGTSNGTSVDVQGPTFDAKLARVKKAAYGVPNYMGEFNCYDNSDAWSYALTLMNGAGWHWTSWTYKTNINSSWGIYNSSAAKVDPRSDDEQTIYDKWADTATERSVRHVMSDGKTLFDIIKAACEAEVPQEDNKTTN